ncbi:MAG TPA: ABC transporter transmembrane domain-containing protein, partial [Chitinophaga sp.]
MHVHIDEHLQHYVICYGQTLQNGKTVFVIGDPGKGIVFYTPEELDNIWKSKFCLTLQPDERFVRSGEVRKQKIAWFKDLIREDIHLLMIPAGLGVLIAALSTTMMIFSQRLIDHIIPDKDYKKLYLSACLVFLLLLAKEGAVALRSHFLINQSKDFNLRIVDRFFSRLLQLPGSFFDTRKIGDLCARLSDTSRMQKVISQLIGNTVIDSLIALVTLSFLFLYSWKVPLICIVTLPFYYLLIYKFNKPILRQQRNIMAGYANVESNYISTFQGIDQVKNYNKQGLFAEKNKTVYDGYQRHILMLGKTQIRLTFLANAAGAVFLMTILILSSWWVLKGNLQTGSLIAILGMCSSLLTSVANLALVSIPVNEAKIAFNRMFEYTGINTEPDEGRVVNAVDTLSVNNIAFRFPGRPELLRDVSLKVRKGEIIAVMGENGCGKSTLGKILQKRYQVEKGTIIVNDAIPLDNISLPAWRKIVGAVEQHVHIFNGSVLENIAFEDAQQNQEKVLAFIQEYGFTDFINGLPQSYMTIIGESGIELSGGQKQIIAFA